MTGFMPIKHGDTVYIENMTWRNGNTDDSHCYFYLYKNDFTILKGGQATTLDVNLTKTYTVGENNQIKSITIDNTVGDTSTCAYLRVSYRPVSGKEPILTINEPIQ